MIFIFKHIVPKGFIGITLYPFIFLKTKDLKENKILINHEKIHLQQQIELLIIFFYFFYGLEFFIKLFKYRNAYITYKNLSFEREAYLNEEDLNYVKTRKPWSFIRHL